MKNDYEIFCYEVDERIALLMSQGHPQAYKYSYSFFKIACRAAIKQQKYMVANFMQAINLSFSKDQNASQKFFEDM